MNNGSEVTAEPVTGGKSLFNLKDGSVILAINDHAFRFDTLEQFATFIGAAIEDARAFVAKKTGKRLNDGESIN